MKQFSASEMANESGISMYTSVAKPGKGDNDAYFGKQAGPR